MVVNHNLQLIKTATAILILMLLLPACYLHRPPPPPPPGVWDGDFHCYYNGRISTAERRKIYPFNKAAHIRIISFYGCQGKAPLANNKVIEAEVKESVILNPAQIDSLTDIIYNYDYHDSTHIKTVTQSGCYYPRHAVLFTNKQQRVLYYIEMCLECGEIRTNMPKGTLPIFCIDKYDLLEACLRAIGIKYFKDERPCGDIELVPR